LHDFLTRNGFRRLEADHCVYTRRHGDAIAILYIWVDDMIIATNTVDEMAAVRRMMDKEFEVKFLGEPRLYLGIEITRERSSRSIILSQRNYIDTLLRRFKLENASTVSTPMVPGQTLLKRDGPSDKVASGLYAIAIGSLLYAAMCTRPDIAFAIQSLSQFTSNPGPEHWTAVKRVLRYLKGTRDYALTYTGQDDEGKPIKVIGYTDADWGSNPVDRKSISGYSYMLGGAAISWSSKKQPTVALSSTEAEYIAATHATRQAVWLRQLLHELFVPQENPTQLLMDNQSAIALTRDAQFHPRTKHIDIQYHFIREKLGDGAIYITYCPTHDMKADLLTKSLAKPRHKFLREELGVHAA
jgi:hypothetical protein